MIVHLKFDQNKVNKKQVVEACKGYGKVKSAIVIGKSAYIQMPDKTAGQAMVRELDGSQIDGKNVRATVAKLPLPNTVSLTKQIGLVRLF